MKFLDKQQIYKVYLENRSKMTEQKVVHINIG